MFTLPETFLADVGDVISGIFTDFSELITLVVGVGLALLALGALFKFLWR